VAVENTLVTVTYSGFTCKGYMISLFTYQTDFGNTTGRHGSSVLSYEPRVLSKNPTTIEGLTKGMQNSYLPFTC